MMQAILQEPDTCRNLRRKHYEELLDPLEEELVGNGTVGADQRPADLRDLRRPRYSGQGRRDPRCRRAAEPAPDAAWWRCAKPSEQERTQWYFQRYVPHLPAAGEIVLFDRSWYNRAGVEKVMGFADEAEVDKFLREAPVFERMLVDDGILLFKYWLTTDQAEAGRAAEGAAGRSAETLETFADRSRRAREIRGLYRGARGHAEGDAHAIMRRGPSSISTIRSAGD